MAATGTLKILITGASSGVGAATARAFAAAGANDLFLCGRNAEALAVVKTECEGEGSTVFTGLGDVSKEEDVERLLREAEENFGGPVDIAVLNAGLNRPSPIEAATVDDFDTVIGVNLKGVFLFMRRLVASMKARGSGQIVVTSSVLGLRGMANAAIYCASKFAIQGMVSSVRKETAGTGVKIGTVCPAGIDTPWWKEKERGGHQLENTSWMIAPDAVASGILAIALQHPSSDIDNIIIENITPKKE